MPGLLSAPTVRRLYTRSQKSTKSAGDVGLYSARLLYPKEARPNKLTDRTGGKKEEENNDGRALATTQRTQAKWLPPRILRNVSKPPPYQTQTVLKPRMTVNTAQQGIVVYAGY